MKDWLVIFGLVILAIMVGSALLPSLLLALNERREKREKEQRRVIILPGE
jgi:hypothetical protein